MDKWLKQQPLKRKSSSSIATEPMLSADVSADSDSDDDNQKLRKIRRYDEKYLSLGFSCKLSADKTLFKTSVFSMSSLKKCSRSNVIDYLRSTLSSLLEQYFSYESFLVLLFGDRNKKIAFISTFTRLCLCLPCHVNFGRQMKVSKINELLDINKTILSRLAGTAPGTSLNKLLSITKKLKLKIEQAKKVIGKQTTCSSSMKPMKIEPRKKMVYVGKLDQCTPEDVICHLKSINVTVISCKPLIKSVFNKKNNSINSDTQDLATTKTSAAFIILFYESDFDKILIKFISLGNPKSDFDQLQKNKFHDISEQKNLPYG
ncbi:hypothetical protein HELRODRAFT_160176 [Helobdella robusta]|uniref:Uncharacterized protein n=1 Tax=Helobdella robusta TaxID=6412 RepID=T1EPX4_HELRO|nr:hypothetical protein HELRODRAFT_160176 [Helobdella robusta]ESO06053.1 hypothetical protein HELRODRAFT_160176 [Helobdella robusta]